MHGINKTELLASLLIWLGPGQKGNNNYLFRMLVPEAVVEA